MKNVASLKSNNTNSPKTPGGISKSLLTPCRRLGLSRNWKKSGLSPFISPLSNSSQVVTELTDVKKESRKRKERIADENVEETTNVINDDENVEGIVENIDKTPSRNVKLPRRKKSKTLITTINKSQEDIVTDGPIQENANKVEAVEEPPNHDCHSNDNVETVVTPVRSKSKTSRKRMSPVKTTPKMNTLIQQLDYSNENETASEYKENFAETNKSDLSKEQKSNKEEPIYTIKAKSPNDLQKECVVVIQRKLFKNVQNNKNSGDQSTKTNEKAIQSDSDSDEEPLINLHKQNSTKSKTDIIADDDNDFIDNKTNKVKPNKVKITKSPKNKLKANKTSKVQPEKVITEPKSPYQNSFDDDDDDFDNKKTILIRKSYDKVSKPIKAKSTGSITQRDIDNLRNRIEAKKKLLLAQSLTPDTEELRSLIKKWQKGCQDALMELLDLMRNKCPGNDDMDYSQMLKALKIPPSLVGYDSDNDCFNSPDDATIILGQFKDL